MIVPGHQGKTEKGEEEPPGLLCRVRLPPMGEDQLVTSTQLSDIGEEVLHIGRRQKGGERRHADRRAICQCIEHVTLVRLVGAEARAHSATATSAMADVAIILEEQFAARDGIALVIDPYHRVPPRAAKA